VVNVVGGEGAVGCIGCCKRVVSVLVILVIISSLLLSLLLLLLTLFDCSAMCGSDDVDSDHLSFLSWTFPCPNESVSMGNGKTMVELCSVEMELSVCR
jgi:hypothetical protein